ncbi:LysR family transcriptional regulator [Actinoallomurus bryophytorum]|uniref:DNA-binding transcriptional LysR family regulator n=1 Tax=Actinoallomurus bryophytorum TaxID=1490222 RepID=A0A543CTS4_9ACTN|nr:LysR family transcriptional regulator [Actinoallomurus bryophytorum]TQM00431.1 DNA-binding transcriptional LysR family regulator [Actinoallomurus bryophytorum]
MELRQLESFLAVVEEGQFARAASRLFLSPPAVTGHIRQLEREIGMPILQRSPVMLTPAGERLIPHARAIVGAAKAASDAVRDIRTEGPAPLRVGVMAPGSAELTPAVLRAFRQAQPQTRITIESLGFTDYITPLLEHRVDAAFVRPAPDDERIAAEVLTAEPRVIIAPATSELADAEELRLADVLEVDYVRLPDATPRGFMEYAYFATARDGMRPPLGLDQVRTAQDLLNSVASGQGIGATLYSLGRFYRWPGIRCVPVVDAPWEASVLATRRNDPRPEVQAFRALAVMIARDLGPKLVPAPKPPS